MTQSSKELEKLGQWVDIMQSLLLSYELVLQQPVFSVNKRRTWLRILNTLADTYEEHLSQVLDLNLKSTEA